MKLSDRFETLNNTRSPDLWSSIENREPGPSPPTMPGGRRAIAVTMALVIGALGIAVAVRAFHPSATQTPVSISGNGLIAYVETDGPGNGPRSIVTIEPDGSGRQVLTAEPGRYGEPASSPNGSRLAFTVTVGTATSRIATMNADGSGLKELTYCSPPECLSDTSPAWSPDGSQLAWARVSGAGAVIPESIFVAGEQRPTTESTLALPGLAFVGGLAWSPDGTSIAFDASKEGTKRFSIYEVDVNSGAVTQLTDCPIAECSFGDLHPSWAPDGSRIVFARDGDLYVMNRSGSGVRQLYACRPSCARAMEPVWSPDGEEIAFAVQMAEQRDLYVMGWDGFGAHRLTDAPGDEFSPAWYALPRSTPEPTMSTSPESVEARVTDTIDIADFPNAIAVGEGAVWVSAPRDDGSFSGDVVRIDPATGTVVARIPVESLPGWEVGGGGMGVGMGSIWVTGDIDAGRSSVDGCCDAIVQQIDPATNRVVDVINLGNGHSADVWVDESGIWALKFTPDDRGQEVVHLDLITHEVIAHIPLPARWSQTIFASGSWIWVSGTRPDTHGPIEVNALYRIDPSTDEVVDINPHSSFLVAVDPEAIWFQKEGDGGLRRIDAVAGELVEEPNLLSVGCCTAPFVPDGEGGVWIASLRRQQGESELVHVDGQGEISAASVIAARDQEAWRGVAFAFDPGTQTIWVVHYRNSVSRIEIGPADGFPSSQPSP
jgi:WD40 repeat protein